MIAVHERGFMVKRKLLIMDDESAIFDALNKFITQKGM